MKPPAYPSRRCDPAPPCQRVSNHSARFPGLTALLAALQLSAPASASVIPCAGDCVGDEAVTVDELVTGVNIALGNVPVSTCAAMDVGGDGEVTVDEIIKAVDKALGGCLETIALSGLPAG